MGDQRSAALAGKFMFSLLESPGVLDYLLSGSAN